jgi:hypothetical protein
MVGEARRMLMMMTTTIGSVDEEPYGSDQTDDAMETMASFQDLRWQWRSGSDDDHDTVQ